MLKGTPGAPGQRRDTMSGEYRQRLLSIVDALAQPDYTYIYWR